MIRPQGSEMTEPTEGFTEKGQSDGRLVLSGIKSRRGQVLTIIILPSGGRPCPTGGSPAPEGGAKKRRRSLRTGRCPPSPAPRLDAEEPRDVAGQVDSRRAMLRVRLIAAARANAWP